MQNTEERIFVVFAMYMGTIVFGILLSEIQDSIAQFRFKESNLNRFSFDHCSSALNPDAQIVSPTAERMGGGRIMTNTRQFLRECEAPRDLEWSIMSEICPTNLALQQQQILRPYLCKP